MPYRCIKPLCDSMECIMCNCAVPEHPLKMDSRTLFETNARRWWPEIDLSRNKDDAYSCTPTRWMYEGWLLASTATVEALRGRE